MTPEQQEQFFKELADVFKGQDMDVDVTPEKQIGNNEGSYLDSLSIISILATIDELFAVSASGIELYRCKTVQEIMDIIERERGGVK